jgi:hypothetical protein
MTNKRPEYREIDKHLLRVDHSYQQPEKPSQIRSLERSWNSAAVVTLLVGERKDESLWIIDGQQRWAAAMSNPAVTVLPCMVVQSTGPKMEAELFWLVDVGRRDVSAIDKFRARLAFGDERAWFVQDSLDLFGLKLSRGAKNKNEVNCIEVLLTKASLDRVAFRRVLEVAAILAAEESKPVNKMLVSGLWYLDRNLEFDLFESNVFKKLKKIGASMLLGEANRVAQVLANRNERAYGVGMLQAINKGAKVRLQWRDGVER